MSVSDRKSFVLFVVDIIVVNFSSSSSFDRAYVANFNVPWHMKYGGVTS